MFPNGVKVHKWPYEKDATEQLVRTEMQKYGYSVYDLQTLPGWFKRSAHAHDYEEIRGAVKGCTTFHFDNDNFHITLEAGDIIIIPAGTIHTVISHNGNEFSGFKGNTAGKRSVTEHGDGKGSLEHLQTLNK